MHSQEIKINLKYESPCLSKQADKANHLDRAVYKIHSQELKTKLKILIAPPFNAGK